MKKLLKLSRRGFPALKFDLKMKLTTLFIITAFFTMQANDSYGQKTKITLDLNNTTVDKLIDKIEETTEFRFVFKMNAVELDRSISISVQNKTIDKVLDQVFNGTKTYYKVLNRRIYLTQRLKTSSKVPKKIQNTNILIQSSVSGTITDSDGQPLPGASIVEKGTTNGTTSDFDGNYTISVADDSATLVVSYIGFGTKEVNVNGQSSISVSLSPSASQLDDVVVIGYGTQKAKNLTGSVSSVKADAIVNQPVISFDEAIAGKIAGVQVAQVSGEPGSGGARIRIRGTSSISAGNDPLYVVDGVPINTDLQVSGGNVPRADGGFSYNTSESVNILSSINSNDIASIEVLKDASAAAIYGSRGSNGVVIITTKRGRKGAPKVSYNTYGGFAQVTKKVDLLNAYELAELIRDGHNNTYLDAVPTGSINDDNATRTLNGSSSQGLIPDNIIPYLNGTPGLTDTDWQDAIFRSAAVQSHNLSVSGGTEKTSYYASLNYLNQEGVVINSDFEQFSGRVNLETKVSDRFKFGFNLNPSQETYNRVTQGPWWSEGVISHTLSQSPIFPVYNSDGTFNFDNNSTELVGAFGNTQFLNPVALASEIQNETSHFRFLGNVFAELNIGKGFSYRIMGGIDINKFHRDYYRPSTVEDLVFIGTPGTPSIPDAFANDNQIQNWVIENTLNYSADFGKHAIDAVLGYSSQKERARSLLVYASNFPNDLVRTTNGGQIINAGGRIEEWSLQSVLARVQYNYDERYLLTATIRSDGSSRFGENNRWGTFPSVSAGWRVSNESFFDSKWISDLKLRASYGVTGNFQIPNYGSVSLVSTENYVDDGGNTVSGLAPSTSANPDLKWERSNTTDIGLDLGLFNNSVYFNFDYYNTTTEDLLLQVPVPSVSGFTSQLTNIGKIRNRGFEAAVSTNFNIGELNVSGTLNFATNQNEVLALGPDNNDIIVATGGGAGFSFLTRVGEELGSYFALEDTGVLSQADIDNGIPVFPGSSAGDLKNRDTNGDGQIDDNDRVIQGSAFPDYTAGLTTTLSYKGFDLGISLQSVQGFEVNALLNRYFRNVEGNFNNHRDVVNRWRSDSDPGNGIIPRANRASKGSFPRPSSWHIEDGSFVRVRNITIGYTLPETVFPKVLNKARIYVAAQNPFTFTDYTYYNPEVSSKPEAALTPGQDYGNYPLAKTFTVGLNIDFN